MYIIGKIIIFAAITMRLIGKITFISFVAAVVSSCGELPMRPMDDYTLARVGRKELRCSDVEQIVPRTLTGEDSTAFVQMYVDRWIIKQLKVQEAELLFSSSDDDIESQVEEYRQSLLIKKIEQYYLDNEPKTEIGDDEIEAYYNAHKSEFRLERTVIKGTVVAFGEKFRQKDKLLEMMRSPKEEVQQDFRDMCTKNNFRLNEMKEWTDFSDFLALLPTIRSRNYDSLTDSREVQKMNADGIQYYFRITAVLKKGEVQPPDMARETILRMLTLQRNAEIIREHENEIMREALENGNARIKTNRQ